MKTNNIQHLLFATSLSMVLFACNKSNSSSSSSTPPSNAQLQTQSDDESQVSNESNAAFDDVNTAMTSQATITGSSENSPVSYGNGVMVEGGNQDTVKSYICDATVTVDTVDNPHTITISYNGSNCNVTRIRKGSIVISWVPGMKWTKAGAVVTVNFDSLKITRVRDGKTIIFNGTHTYTNVSGGSLLSLTSNSATPIIHTITSSNMSITFASDSVRSWSVARQRQYSYNNGLVITTTGLQTQGTVSGISEWGTTRFGNSFTVQIAQPLILSQSCGFQLTSGEHILTDAKGTTDITYGLDATGAA